jgi:hypothetical protein
MVRDMFITESCLQYNQHRLGMRLSSSDGESQMSRQWNCETRPNHMAAVHRRTQW